MLRKFKIIIIKINNYVSGKRLYFVKFRPYLIISNPRNYKGDLIISGVRNYKVAPI